MRFNLVRACTVLVFSLMANSSFANEVSVDVVTAQLSQDSQIVKLIGTVEAMQNAQLAAQRAGLVQSILVHEGDSVEYGTELLHLDDTLALIELEQAHASVQAAKVVKLEAIRLYEEVLALSKQKVVAQTLIDERRANAEIAKADLVKQEMNFTLQQEVVRRFKVTAPFAGVVASREVDIGEWITPSSRLFTLIGQDQLRLKVAVPQQYYPQLRGASNVAATVTSDLEPTQSLALELSSLVPASTNKSRTMIGYIYLPEDSGFIVGSSAQVQLALPHSSLGIVWLPKSALKQHPDGGASVFVVEGNKAKRLIVRVIEQNEHQVAVSGVNDRQKIVTTGVEVLRDGRVVKVKSPASSQ